VDLALAVVEVAQAGIEGGGLAGPGRAADQHQPAGAVEQRQQAVQPRLNEAEFPQVQQAGVAHQQAEGAVLAVQRRQDVDAQVDAGQARPVVDQPAVLRPAVLGDVQAGPHLEVADAAVPLLGGQQGQQADQAEVADQDGDLCLLAGEEEVGGPHRGRLLQQRHERLFGLEAVHRRRGRFVHQSAHGLPLRTSDRAASGLEAV
jgi:hypothetical protein